MIHGTGNIYYINEGHKQKKTKCNGILKGGVVIPLIFPHVPQSSQTESLGFPRNTPSPWFHPRKHPEDPYK